MGQKPRYFSASFAAEILRGINRQKRLRFLSEIRFSNLKGSKLRPKLPFIQQLSRRPSLADGAADIGDDLIRIYRQRIVYVNREDDMPAVGQSDDADIVDGADDLDWLWVRRLPDRLPADGP